MLAYIPSSFSPGKKHSPKWFNRRCHEAVCQKNKFFQAYRSDPSSEKHALYKQARNECCTVIEEAKSDFVNKIADKLLRCPTGSRAFWSLSKAICNNFSSSRFPPMVHPDGHSVTLPSEKATVFAQHFSSNSTLMPSALPVPSLPTPSVEMSRFNVCERKVLRVLKSLETNKAVGADEIPSIEKMCSRASPYLISAF